MLVFRGVIVLFEEDKQSSSGNCPIMLSYNIIVSYHIIVHCIRLYYIISYKYIINKLYVILYENNIIL